MPRPRKKPVAPRRVWHGQDKLRLAYFAGLGLTAAQIADAIGGTTAQRVRAILAKSGIQLRGISGRQILSAHLRTSHANAFAALANDRGREPTELAALLLQAVTQRPELIDELVHDNDAI